MANAGTSNRGVSWEVDPDEWWHVFEVNVLGVHLCCRTAMTDGFVPDDAPWTSPECAPQLVRALATGEFDALTGRYLHAEHDPPESLRGRVDEIVERDLNAIRLQRG